MAIVQNDSQTLTQEELDLFPKLTSENLDSLITQVFFILFYFICIILFNLI